MTQFQLQTHLDHIYQQTQHQFAFSASQQDAAQTWQHQFRDALRDCLKIAGRTMPANPKSERLSTVDKGNYIEEKHNLQVEGVATPMYLLIPKGEPPYPVVMAFHGHGMGVHQILGNYDDPQTAVMYRENDENFAQRLAEDGYLVCAVEQQGFGERVTDLLNQPSNENSCRHLAFSYMLHGRTLLGERVWDGMTAVSYVLGRDDVMGDCLSCVGFSGGATTTLFLSALDERIQQTVIAGYFCTLKQSILGVQHCECNYVPDLLTIGETGDIAGLIAPRRVRIISGESDPIFPVAGVRQQYARLEAIYKVFGACENCSITIHPYGHRFVYRLVQSWLAEE